MTELPDKFVDASAKQEHGVSSAPVVITAIPAPGKNVTLLLATARRWLVAWFQLALATEGLSLAVSPDGLHALMSAVRQPPELVLLDDDLPGVDAERVEQMLARDARTARARVMHFTALPNIPERDSGDA